MEAKQMFEKLGYSIHLNDEYEFSYLNEKDDKEITFFYEDIKVWVYNPENCDAPVEINMDLLRAINKQCEELEWI